MKKKNLYILASIILLLITGCSRKNRVIATFDNGKVLQKELDLELGRYPEEERQEILNSTRKIKPVIESIAIKKISLLYARKTNIIDVAKISNSILNNYRSDLTAFVFSRELTPAKVKIKGSDIEKFSSQLKIKLIWLKTFQWMDDKQIRQVYNKAKEVLKQLRKGRDFGEMANQYSEDPGNYKNGFLGIITDKDFDQDVLDQIKKLEPDKFSPIIQSKMGFHIFKPHRDAGKARGKGIVLSHILIKTNNNGRKKAEEIYTMLEKGADFTIIANEFSEDKSNFKDGDIPNFAFSRVYYALADAAYKVKPGKISPIIETDYGYFIVKNEKVTKPNKDQLKELEKRDRYLNRIESIKSRYYNMVQENDLKKKIRDRYTININTALLTNKTAQPDDIIVSIPKTDIKVTYGECKGIIMLKMGTTSLADRKAKIQKIYEEYILPELIYHYAKDKKYDRDDEFQVNLSNKFLNTIYLQLENNLNLPVNVTEEELKEYYRKNEQKYYITKVVNKKPARVKQSFRDAKEIIKRNVEHEKRQTEIEKWRQSLLKEYHFNIDYSRLGLKKDANYYLKIGDKHFNNGKFKKALKYYKKALEKDKELTEIYVKLLLSYNNLNDEKSILTTTEQLQHVKNIDVEVLLKALSVKDEKLKRKFIEMIGLTGNIAAESKLIELYENEKEVKNLQSIIRALGLIKSNRAYDIFFKDLNNFETQFKEYSQNDKEVLKWYLIEAIGYIGKKESTTYLIGLLKKTDDLNLKCFIIEAFGRIRDNNAVPILEKLLEDKVWGVRVLAAESLKNITGKEYKIKDKSREATP